MEWQRKKLCCSNGMLVDNCADVLLVQISCWSLELLTSRTSTVSLKTAAMMSLTDD